MFTYRAPLTDIEFVFNRWLSVSADWAAMPAYAHLDVATVQQVCEAAGRFASCVLAPLNASGDLEGCRYDNGEVRPPTGFRDAYRAFVNEGWPTLGCQMQDGGQGLPHLLQAAVHEMLTAANHAWMMYPGLAAGAYACLRAHGSAEIKLRYLPKLVTGEWLATMCLTEAHAGSDVGSLSTRAEPAVDTSCEQSYRISGTKIFISGGEHDLTENIIHLVLARLPGAPAGTKGISLFVVPKLRWQEGRWVGNGMRCEGIEKKMGIKGSATCVMRFDGASGWMVGEPNRGLAAMFVMMNSARLHVGLQGLAHAEVAHQIASNYAHERVQMRAPAAPRARSTEPIIHHPAVRLILLRLRAYVEGQRCIGYWIAHLLDISEHHSQPARRAEAGVLVSLLTPVAKAFFTENGFLLANDALQVLGGHGYIRDNAIEQTVRDSRVALIYEGTNEIQAIDLLLRKIVADSGAALEHLLKIMEAEADTCGALADCQVAGIRLRELCGSLRTATQAICVDAGADPELPYRVAKDYLRLVGIVLLAFAWARADRVSKSFAVADAGCQAKRVTAKFVFEYVLPEAEYRVWMLRAGRSTLPTL